MKKTVVSLFSISTILFVLFLLNRGKMRVDNVTGAKQRIVSMAPSITELLYELGLGDEVVGVSDFCNYPADAKKKVRVGGYINPNYEAIIALQAKFVVLTACHEKAIKQLKNLGIETVAVDHSCLSGILDSYLKVGRRCGCEERAIQKVAELRRRISAVEQKSKWGKHPRVLICIGRSVGEKHLREVYVAGQDGYYSKLLELAGAKPAYTGKIIKFPKLSAVNILEINPDVIIDLTNVLAKGQTVLKVKEAWKDVEGCTAFKNSNIYIVPDDYAIIPGPRFILLLEKISDILHSEAVAR